MKTLLILAVLSSFAHCAWGDDTNATTRLGAGGAELQDMLSVLVSTNSPLGNLAHNLGTNLQVSLPPCRGPLPGASGEVVLEPFNDAKAGLRLTITIETRTLTRLIVRADVNYYDPKRGYANMGAEWKQLEFKMEDGHWRLSMDLGGAIK